jgi:hypothetical protein
MANDHEFPRDDAERAWLAALPRTSTPGPSAENQLVRTLRREGYFGRGLSISTALLGMAAAIVLFASGALVGAHIDRGSSLEAELLREPTSSAERVLLLQRAGSAYLRSMQLAASAPHDSVAAEVVSQALVAAAQAAARAHLDNGLSPRLVALLDARSGANAAPQSTLIWY